MNQQRWKSLISMQGQGYREIEMSTQRLNLLTQLTKMWSMGRHERKFKGQQKVRVLMSDSWGWLLLFSCSLSNLWLVTENYLLWLVIENYLWLMIENYLWLVTENYLWLVIEDHLWLVTEDYNVCIWRMEIWYDAQSWPFCFNSPTMINWAQGSVWMTSLLK